MRIRAVLLAILFTAWARSTPAYTGGPEYVEVHGWDPAERTVYCSVHRLGDGPCWRIFAFPLDSARQSLATRLRWSSSSKSGDIDARRWNALVRRLQPLELIEGPALPRVKRVVAADTLDDQHFGRAPRFRVRISTPLQVPGPDLVVVTLHEPSVTFHRAYHIPGRSEVLVVLAFIGQIDGPEEVQVPVLLRASDEPEIQVEWKQCEQ